MSDWVILGANGMLGRELTNLLPPENCIALTRSECDITKIDSLREIVTSARVVINCAAYTAVDDAETNEGAAYEINGAGAGNVAQVCAELGAKLIHISTDYVFPGDATKPYSENAPTGPKTAYGRTKLAGEHAIQKLLPNDHYIVRTAWLYGQYGPNFVKTIINLESQRDTISVVADQIGQPTWTFDLAEKLIQLKSADAKPGIYHGTSSGQASWFEFAHAIFEQIGADPNRVKPVTSSEFIRPAPRPEYSVLGHGNWSKNNIRPIRNWKLALESAFQSDGFS